MTSVNVWSRAVLAIVRKPIRSGLIGLLMLLVFTGLVAQAGVSAALQDVADRIGGSMGIGFAVEARGDPISAKEADRFAHLDGVKKAAYETKTFAELDGAQPVVPQQGPRLDVGVAAQVSVLGSTDSSLSTEFQSGLYRLEQGKHISGDGDGVLVHRDFAQRNGLSVGSTFTLKQGDHDSTVRVSGIFSGKTQSQSPMPSDSSENLLYAGMNVASKLTGEPRIDTVRCLSASAQSLPDTIRKAKELAGTKYDVTDNSSRFSGVLQAVNTVRNLVRLILAVVCLVGVLVLGMVLVFWVRSRIHEIGVFLAIGIGKARIVGQFVIETCLMALVAALCSLGTGALLSGFVSSMLLANADDASLSSLQVDALPPAQTSLILLLGCGVIAIALVVSLASVLARSPKSILSSMS